VLHHLFRGTGLAGLRGIPAVRVTSSGCRLIRPLLAVRRHQVEDYLRSCGQPFCTDQTNWDTAITRNKLRHVILPLLREQLNPQIDAALSRLSEQAG
jgi:tRNA(Ile)-lysidine synthase